MTDTDLILAGARRRSAAIATGSVLAAALAIAAGVAGWLHRDREVVALFGLVAGSATLATTVLTALWLIERARCGLLAAHETRQRAAETGASSTAMLGGGLDAETLVASEERRLRHAAGWMQPAVAVPGCAGAIALLVWLRPTPAAANDLALVLGISSIVLSFPILLAERRLHATRSATFPEGHALARILRLAVWVLVVGGSATAARAYDIESAVWAQWALMALTTGIAGEILLRALGAPFLPVAHAGEAQAIGDSLIAGLVLRRGEGGAVLGGLKERFGIDLAQSWAVRFLRRAALPLLTVLAVITWLISGLTTLGTGERGVYERCGAPVEILGPGLHAHLPWPFGQVRRVEFGQIHELVLAGSGDTQALPVIGADEDTPAPYDRLWDRQHPADGTWLLPGSGSVRGTSGYQLMSADVRVLYRVGLDDAAARDNAYRVDDGAAVVRGQALRQIQRIFASRTLASVIGEDRDRLARDLKDGIQAQLAATGIEVTTVVIDAIHPPIGAVPAYHGVQAAGIQAATDVARARGLAATTSAEARREAADRTAVAKAVAGEAVADARTRTTRYNADRTAFAVNPAASRLERWLTSLRTSLPRADLTIVDHRLPIEPTIDLRKAGGAE